jgi:4-diphosphocytidyl-2-C-methyl-D-erythritol kinase
VPFFLVGGTALGTGRGTDVEPLPDLPPLWAVLLPGRKVSTAAVYAALAAGTVREWEDTGIRRWRAGVGSFPFSECHNDLEPAVAASFPWVADRLRLLRSTAPLLSMVAGSGATVFALYESKAMAHDVARESAAHDPVVAPLLSRVASRQPLLA